MTSSKRPGPPAWAAAALLLGLMAVVVALQVYRDRRFREEETSQQLLYVRSPAVMTRLALSYDAVASDLYWIRAIQYDGGTRLSANPDKHYELLYPLLDLTTSLDPRFSIAYRFGAFFLSERAPGGAGRPDLAIALLQKAMAANPERWEYPYDIGFVHYRYQRYAEAADWFRRAARVPGATNWLEPLAAVTLAAGGDLTASRMLWQNLLTSSEQEWLRRTAEQRLRQLDAIAEIQRLQALTAEYERRHGDVPPTWDALVADGALRQAPTDPEGHVYVLNPYWGTVTLSDESPLWPLPTEEGAVMTVGVPLLFFAFGLLVGSFLNVCIYRLPRRESLNWPGSHCPSCSRPLSWYENIPLASWLVLRGRCRTCRTPISAAYPIVEALTGVVFLAAFALYGMTPLLAVRLLFACAMIVLFVIDLRHRILPNVITVPGIVIGFAASLWLPPGWRSSLLGLLIGGGLLFLIGEAYYRARGIVGMGMGDVKMLAMIGAALGWPLMLLTLILASFTGALFGALMMASGKGGMKAALPFGTFLAVGAVVSAVAGTQIVDWYAGFYR